MDLIGGRFPKTWAYSSYPPREIQKKLRQIRAGNGPESEINALFTEEKEHEGRIFDEEKYNGKVGAFEGVNYEAKGYY